MNSLISWFAGNRVAANTVLILTIALGLMVAPSLPRESFPEASFDLITVTIEYPGASPDEVEEAICVRVEERIYDLKGIRRVTSRASEGVGLIGAELERGTSPAEIREKIKSRIDTIDSFPADAKRPIVEETTTWTPVVDVAIYGDADPHALRAEAERVRDNLSSIPGITQVEIVNARPFEISVEVSERALRRHGLSFDDVAETIRSSSLHLPGGTLKTESADLLLRTSEQAYRGTDFATLPLLTRPDGTRVLLGDVAPVVDGFSETGPRARFDGLPALLVHVSRTGDQDLLGMAKSVRDYVHERQSQLPPGISLAISRDQSTDLQSRQDLLLKNGAQGLVLVILCIALFLRTRLAIWVSLSIPIAFLGATALLAPFDVSINLISLLGFIMALGLIVDESIVVAESIAHAQESDETQPLPAAIRGTLLVAVPVTLSVVTTIAAFAPMLRFGGIVGAQVRPLPLVMIGCLIFSLVESLLVLPAHLGHRRRETRLFTRLSEPIDKLGDRVSGGLLRFRASLYEPLLERSLRHPFITLCAAFAFMTLTGGLIGGGWVSFVFLPNVPGDYATAIVTLPHGTPETKTEIVVSRLEQNALRMQQEMREEFGREIVRHVLTSVGDQPEGRLQNLFSPLSWGSFSAAHLGEVQLELIPAEQRSISAAEVADRWHAQMKGHEGVAEISYVASAVLTGDPVDIEIAGGDPKQLADAAEDLKRDLRSYPGTRNVSDSLREGKAEVKMRIRPEAEALGITAADLARQIRQGFYGEEAQRFQRGRDDVKVMVRYPSSMRRSLGDLDSVRIRTPQGAEVPLAAVASFDLSRGVAEVQRSERRRSVNVTADVDRNQADEGFIIDSLETSVLPALREKYRELRFSPGGQQREQDQFDAEQGRLYGIALALVFAVLAIPLRSYTWPFLIMSAIPIAVAGTFWAHALLGVDQTGLSVIATIGLAGIVVNDSLVLSYTLRGMLEPGTPIRHAVLETCRRRFRPIVLTSLTTIFGLLPLLLESSSQAEWLKSIAVTLASGVLFSTVAVLLILPAGFCALETIGDRFRRIRDQRELLRAAGQS